MFLFNVHTAQIAVAASLALGKSSSGAAASTTTLDSDALLATLSTFSAASSPASSAASSSDTPASASAIITLTHVSDFDENGLFYYLGSAGRTTAWQNPHTRGDVVVTCADLKKDSNAVSVRYLGFSTDHFVMGSFSSE